MNSFKSAFTLVELLVAVTILVVFTGISMVSFSDLLKQNDLLILRKEVEGLLTEKQADVLNGKFANTVFYFNLDASAYLMVENRIDDSIRDANLIESNQAYDLHFTDFRQDGDNWLVEFEASGDINTEILYREDENGNSISASNGVCAPSNKRYVDCIENNGDLRLYTYFLKDINGKLSNKARVIFLNSKKDSTLTRITGIDVGNVETDTYKSAKVVIRSPLAKPEISASESEFKDANGTYSPVKNAGLQFDLPNRDKNATDQREIWLK